MEQETKTEPGEKQIVENLFKELHDYEQATQDNREELLDIYNAYMGKLDDVVSLPYKNQETILKLRTEVSYIKPFVFSGSPEIEVEGVGEEDKTISAILEKIVNFRLNQSIPNAYDKIEDWVHQAVTFGTSIIKVYWKFETKKLPDGTETPAVDMPDLEVPNILDIYRNPLIPEIDQQSSIICRSVVPLESVKTNPMYDYQGENGLNRERLEPGKSDISPYNSSKQADTDVSDYDKASAGMVEVFERYTKDRIQTVAKGKEALLIRDVANPYGYINAVKFVFEKNTIPNRFDGLGVGQNTMGVGKLYFKAFNQTLDNVTLTNNPMFMFAKGTKIDKRQLVSKPGGGIEVDSQGKSLSEVIQPVQFPDIKNGAVMLLDKLDDEHKRASGANDLLQGMSSNKTFGQDQLATSFSSGRFEIVQRRFKQALADLADMLIDLELRNLQSPDAEILRIFPEEIRMQVYQLLINEAQGVKYNIKVKGDTTIAKNKDIQIKQLTDIYNLFGAILPPENQMEFARKLLELRGIDEIDRLVPDPQQFAQQQQMMQQEQMMGAVSPEMMQEQPTNQGIQNSTYAQ